MIKISKFIKMDFRRFEINYALVQSSISLNHASERLFLNIIDGYMSSIRKLIYRGIPKHPYVIESNTLLIK